VYRQATRQVMRRVMQLMQGLMLRQAMRLSFLHGAASSASDRCRGEPGQPARWSHLSG